MVMTWSMSASTSASWVWGLMKQGRIARRPSMTVEVGVDRVVRRSRSRISALTGSLAA